MFLRSNHITLWHNDFSKFFLNTNPIRGNYENFPSHISYKKERGEIDKNLCIHLLFFNCSPLFSLFIQFKIKIVMSTEILKD